MPIDNWLYINKVAREYLNVSNPKYLKNYKRYLDFWPCDGVFYVLEIERKLK